jgi:hypothetical protein
MTRTLAVLVPLLVGACAQTAVRKDEAFDSTSDKAVIIVGLDGVKGSPYWLDIHKFDPNTQQLEYTRIASFPFGGCRWVEKEGQDWESKSRLGTISVPKCHEGIQYPMVKVTPGDYIIRSVRWRGGRLTRTTYYYTVEGLFDRRAGSAARFTVGPGEIVYLGDFTFDSAPFPAKLVNYRFDIPAAEAALRELKNIKGPVVTRSVVLPPPSIDQPKTDP